MRFLEAFSGIQQSDSFATAIAAVGAGIGVLFAVKAWDRKHAQEAFTLMLGGLSGTDTLVTKVKDCTGEVRPMQCLQSLRSMSMS